MQKNKIRYIDYKTKDEWLAIRKTGIGGSEVASVMGVNQYKSNVELFYEKLGLLDRKQDYLPVMFFGNVLEPVVADLWQYWNPEKPTMEEMIINHSAQNIIRRCRKLKRLVTSKDFDFLYGSVDRMIVGAKGVLEIKTISKWASQQWETGIPPMYFFQLQTYMYLTNSEFGEMAMLQDGRDLKVYRFERDEQTIAEILERCSHFWNRVKAAKVLIEKRYDASPADQQKIDAEVQHLEPDADSHSYDFMNANRRDEATLASRQGTLHEYGLAVEVKTAQRLIKKLEEIVDRNKAQLLQRMSDCFSLGFGDEKVYLDKRGSMKIKIQEFDFVNQSDFEISYEGFLKGQKLFTINLPEKKHE